MKPRSRLEISDTSSSQDESILSISSSNLSLSNSSSSGKDRALRPANPNLSGSSSSSGKPPRKMAPPPKQNKLKRVTDMPRLDQISEILPRGLDAINSGIDLDIPELDVDSIGEMHGTHGFSESISAIVPKESRSSKALEKGSALKKMKRPSDMNLPLRTANDVDMGNLSDDFIDSIISRYSAEQLLAPGSVREMKPSKLKKEAKSDSISDGMIDAVMAEEEHGSGMKTEIMDDFAEEESIHKTSESSEKSTTEELLDGLVSFGDGESEDKMKEGRSKSAVSLIVSDFTESSKAGSKGRPGSRSGSSVKSKDAITSDFIVEPVSGLSGDFVDESKADVAEVLSSDAIVEEPVSNRTGIEDDFVDESKSGIADVLSSEAVVEESKSNRTGIEDDFVEESKSGIADVLSSDAIVEEPVSNRTGIEDDFVEESKSGIADVLSSDAVVEEPVSNRTGIEDDFVEESKSGIADVLSSDAIVEEPVSNKTGILDDDFVDESKSAIADVFSSEAIVEEPVSNKTGIEDDFVNESKSEAGEVFSSEAIVDEPVSKITGIDDDFVDESKYAIADVFSSEAIVEEPVSKVTGIDDDFVDESKSAIADVFSSEAIVDEPVSKITGIDDDFVDESKTDAAEVFSSEAIVEEPISNKTGLLDDFVDESKSAIADVFSSEAVVEESKSKTTGIEDDFVHESNSEAAEVFSSEAIVEEPVSKMTDIGNDFVDDSKADAAEVFSSDIIVDEPESKLTGIGDDFVDSKSQTADVFSSEAIVEEPQSHTIASNSQLSHSKRESGSAEVFSSDVIVADPESKSKFQRSGEVLSSDIVVEEPQSKVFSSKNGDSVFSDLIPDASATSKRKGSSSAVLGESFGSRSGSMRGGDDSESHKSDTMGFIEAFSEIDSKEGETKHDSSTGHVETGLSVDDFVQTGSSKARASKSDEINADVFSEDIDDFTGDTTEIGKSSLPADDIVVETLSKIESGDDFIDSKSTVKSSNGKVSALDDSDFIKSKVSGMGVSEFIDSVATSKIESKSDKDSNAAEDFGSDGEFVGDESEHRKSSGRSSRSRLLSNEVLEELSSHSLSREGSIIASKSPTGSVQEFDDIDFIDDGPSKQGNAISGLSDDFVESTTVQEKSKASPSLTASEQKTGSRLSSRLKKAQPRKEQRRPSYVEFSDIEGEIERRIEAITGARKRSLQFCGNLESVDVSPEVVSQGKPSFEEIERAHPPEEPTKPQKQEKKRRRRKKPVLFDFQRRSKPLPTLQVMPAQDSNVNYLNFIEEQKMKLRHIRQGNNASRQMRALRQAQVVVHNYEIADDNFDEVERALQLRSPAK